MIIDMTRTPEIVGAITFLGREFKLWDLVGFFGQTVFFSRFLIQWIVSEKQKESVIPIAFWYLSLAGSAITLTYAIGDRQPVFTLAMGVGFFIYTRNLLLIRRTKLKDLANNS